MNAQPKKKVEPRRAEERLCEALKIPHATGGYIFFATVEQEMKKAKLTLTELARCVSMETGAGANARRHFQELQGSGPYGEFVDETTLQGLINVLRAAMALTVEEKEAIDLRHEERPLLDRRKSLATYYADAIIEKRRIGRGVEVPEVAIFSRS